MLSINGLLKRLDTARPLRRLQRVKVLDRYSGQLLRSLLKRPVFLLAHLAPYRFEYNKISRLTGKYYSTQYRNDQRAFNFFSHLALAALLAL